MRVPPVQTSGPVSVIDWLSTHAHMLGWGFIITVCVKAIQFFARVARRFERAEETLQTMATNHVTHIEQSIASVDTHMQGMREDVKGLREDMKDFSLAVLSNRREFTVSVTDKSPDHQG